MYRRNLRYSRVKNLYKFATPKMNTVFTVESSIRDEADAVNGDYGAASAF